MTTATVAGAFADSLFVVFESIRIFVLFSLSNRALKSSGEKKSMVTFPPSLPFSMRTRVPTGLGKRLFHFNDDRIQILVLVADAIGGYAAGQASASRTVRASWP